MRAQMIMKIPYLRISVLVASQYKPNKPGGHDRAHLMIAALSFLNSWFHDDYSFGLLPKTFCQKKKVI